MDGIPDVGLGALDAGGDEVAKQRMKARHGFAPGAAIKEIVLAAES